MNPILKALTRSGVKVTPETVRALQQALFRRVWLNDDCPEHMKVALSETNKLLGQMLAIKAPGPVRPAQGSYQHEAKPASVAAIQAMHDRVQAKRRKGGRIKPRPRWSDDYKPSQWAPERAPYGTTNPDPRQEERARKQAALVELMRSLMKDD